MLVIGQKKSNLNKEKRYMAKKIGFKLSLPIMTAVVIGVLALMVSMGMFSGQKLVANDIAPELDGVRIGGGPVAAPAAAQTMSAAGTSSVTITPPEVGATAKIVISTGSGTTAILEGDIITLTMESVFGVPTAIATSDIIMTSSTVSNVSGAANVRVNPKNVTVEFTGQKLNTALIHLEVPDMDPTTAGTGGAMMSGSQGIGAAGTVSITIAQSAGITNPTEADSPTVGVSASLASSATEYATAVTTAGTSLPRKLTSSTTGTSRGGSVTVTGYGFKNSTTATVWLDTNNNKVRDAGEVDLAEAVVASDDTFSATFSLAVPPFSVSATNYVSAIDGKGSTTNANITLSVSDKIIISPTTAAVGETIQITMQDFPASHYVVSGANGAVKFGSVSATVQSNTIIQVGSDGSAVFDVIIPNAARTGTQTVYVYADANQDATISGASASANITITGATLTATPNAIVPNQTVNLQGSGWTDGGSATVNAASDASVVSLGGSTTGLRATGSAAISAINAGNGSITIDNGGNWSGPVVIPMTSGSMNGGTQLLEVTDNGGRTGNAELTIASRALSISPASSGLGTTITVAGTGYPAENSSTGASTAPTVTMTYYYGSSSKNVATFTPDGTGAFSGSFTVPLDAPIPSDNLVKSAFSYTPSGGAATTVTNTVSHSVPTASLGTSASSGAAGTKLTISGSGFKAYSTVTTLTVGGVDARPAPVPATDGTGTLSTEIMVPSLAVGSHAISITIASTTASANFSVTSTGISAAASDAVGDAIGTPVGDNLVRVFAFDNATKDWSFYDPSPDLADANTLSNVSAGSVYWIKTLEDATVALNGTDRALYSGWNLVSY
jgi:hypothetical protein